MKENAGWKQCTIGKDNKKRNEMKKKKKCRIHVYILPN